MTDVSLDQLSRRFRRRERLRAELIDADVALPRASEVAALTEIDRARFPRRHERRFPTYGAIISNENQQQLTAALDELGVTRCAVEPDLSLIHI